MIRRRAEILSFVFLALVAASTARSDNHSTQDASVLLDQAYESFRSGDVVGSRQAAQKALNIGTSQNAQDTIGGALTALCRVALRENDAAGIESLTNQLTGVAEASGDEKWRVYSIHMRAELARMNDDLDVADALYVESLELSERIGLTGMIAAENFNRSFVSVARGKFDQAREQIRSHFDVSAQMNDGIPGAYGLIALANLLAAQDQLEEAAVVALSTRRLFELDGIIPDPADAAPLEAVEALIGRQLSESELEQARNAAAGASVQQLLDRHL